MSFANPIESRRPVARPVLKMSRPVRMAAVAMAIGALCASLGGCISDAGTPVTRLSQDTQDQAPLRYYGGPKSPMW